ncbi:c-type cytochrome [Flavobacterium sp. MFBS3-15]|uniref:c-type cytochrome n=1 Tax=Flavobacterium sp. MFBS3-15 TaxID=2989816 RepID=UPI002235E086|nr:c-type cytochrome [Flavobacterium sp. MFBS3-15]MCW4469228.1 c-type cytochrome [Flavobacterium sp. MFBS3-15]
MKGILFLLITFSVFSCKRDSDYNTDQNSGGSSEEGKFIPEEKTDYIYTTTNVSEGEVTNLTPQQKLGQEIFDGKGNCFTCHKPEQKAIGPSIQEIAKIYKDQKGDMAAFLLGEGDPIVDPSQYEVMKTNFYITKTFTDGELKAVEAYIYSFTAL